MLVFHLVFVKETILNSSPRDSLDNSKSFRYKNTAPSNDYWRLSALRRTPHGFKSPA
jgi:hypothetical protein